MPVPAEPASRRERPLLMVFTGEGKGKTTAAMGMALRAWHRGWPVGVFQFVKSGRWPTGERAAFQALDAAHQDSGVGAPVHWENLGNGFTWLPRRTGPEPAALAQHGWSRVAQALATQQYTFVLLDELSYPLARGWVDVEEVVAALAARPGFQQVAITGRGCPEALLAAADLVTTMTKVRHPFDAGHRGQQGIEW